MSLEDPEAVKELLIELLTPKTRGSALEKLSQTQDVSKLAPYLWFTSGVLAVLVEEVLAGYTILSSPRIPQSVVERLSHVFCLMREISVHPDTWLPFIQSQLPVFLFPYLAPGRSDKPFHCLRVATLSVISSMARMKEPKVLVYMARVELIPQLIQITASFTGLERQLGIRILQEMLKCEGSREILLSTQERKDALVALLTALSQQDSKPTDLERIQTMLAIMNSPDPTSTS